MSSTFGTRLPYSCQPFIRPQPRRILPETSILWKHCLFSMASENPTKIGFGKFANFGKRDSHEWHKKIHTTARVLPSNLQFPFTNPFWEELRRHTESYLKKKGSITQGHRDKRLQSLIKEHELLYGGEVLFTVGACARFMSPETVKSALKAESLKAAGNSTKFDLILRMTIIAYRENPLAVTLGASQLAEALIWCYQPHGLQSVTNLTSRKLEQLFRSLVVGVPGDNIIYPHALQLVAGLAMELRGVVESLKDSHKWMEIRAVTGWFSDVLPKPQLNPQNSHTHALRVLDAGFPEWQAWSGWKACDTELAQSLLQLPPQNPESPREALEFLVKLQMNMNPKANSYMYQYVCETMRKYAALLASRVVTLKGSGHWLEAHEQTGWLSILQDVLESPSNGAESMKILDIEFSDWREWAHWDERDSRIATAIIPCQTPDVTATGQYFEILIGLMLDGIPSKSLLRSHICDLVRNSSKYLGQRLKELAAEGHWSEAFAKARCLYILVHQSSQQLAAYGEVVQIVTEEFIGWKQWTLWRATLHRLKVLERLTNEERRSLLDLLALEGPDFEPSGQPSMREGIIARNQHTQKPELRWSGMHLQKEYVIKCNVRHVLERLSDVIQKACEAGPGAVELLIHLCCFDQPIDENALAIVEGCIIMADASLLLDVLHVLKGKNSAQTLQVGSLGRSTKNLTVANKETLFHDALARLLKKLTLASSHTFREALTPRLIISVSTRMRKIQVMLHVYDKNTSLVQLHSLGKSLQETQWLLPLLDDSMGVLIRNWPSLKKFSDMNALRTDVRKAPLERWPSLSLRLDNYYSEYLIEPGNLDQETKDLIETLIDLWQEIYPSEPKRLVALILADYEAVGSRMQLEILRQLGSLPNDFVVELSKILEIWTKEPFLARIKCTHLLAHSLFADQKFLSCWRSLLFSWLMDQDLALFEYTIRSLKIRAWHQWLLDLQLAFPAMDTLDVRSCPRVFQSPMHLWSLRVTPYLAAIEKLESISGSELASQCIRAGYESDYSGTIVQILKLLEENLIHWDEGGKFQAAVQGTLLFLDKDGKNATQLYRALSGLLETKDFDFYVIDIYVRIIEMYQGFSPSVASALLSGWLKSPNLANFNTLALENLVGLIDIENNQLDEMALKADRYISNELHALHAESKRLHILRGCLKAKDPDGVSALCLKFGINDTSPLEDEVARLPNHLVNAIELVDESIVEFNFSLAHCTALQRIGTGLFKTESLVVRVVFGSNSLPASFCIHLGGSQDSVINISTHYPWLLVENKLKNIHGVCDVPCLGHMDRTVYRLGRVLSNHLDEATMALEETYRLLKLSLEQAGEVCMICGSPHGVRLLRSTPCMNPACERAYLQSNLSLYTKDIRQDPQVADLLITAVQAATNTGNMALLPNWPYETFEPILEVLEKLPPLATLRASKDIKCAMESWNERVEQFIKRVFGHYGGFLVSASGQSPSLGKPGQIRIPSMPGAYQFLLANAAPHLEKAFASRKGSGNSTVVFHGTSLDRLYSILSIGLQGVHVNRPGRYGGAGCTGIYVAEEPLTSFAFAMPYYSHLGLRGWKSGTFDNFRVLLACEATGIVPGRGVHVISDPSQVLVRYVFLIPLNMIAPRAIHIAPAIASVLASLRSGAL